MGLFSALRSWGALRVETPPSNDRFILHGRSGRKRTVVSGRTDSVRAGSGWKFGFFVLLASSATGGAYVVWRDRSERVGGLFTPLPPPPRPRRPPSPPSPPPEGTSPEAVLGLERPEDEPLDPIAPAGDLAADVAAFTDLRECAGRHRIQDPLVADLVDAIGYDTLVVDACRGVKALKTKDFAVCDGAAAQRMRDRCVAQVAMLLGQDEGCPTDVRVPDFPEHDVTCLAVARRDVRPCAALDGIERATCEGLVARDAARCGTDPRCLRLVARWRSSLPAVTGKTPYPASLRLEVTTADESGGFAEESFDLAREAAGGAVIVQRRGETRVVIGDPRPIPAHGDVRGGVAFVVDRSAVRAAAPRVTVRWASGLVSELTTATTPKIAIERLTAEPGAPLKLTVEAMLGPTTSVRKTRWTIDTWVRDVVVVASPPR